MGSDAHAYVFDYDRYVTDVIPVAKRLLLMGELAPRWARMVRQVLDAYELEGYTEGTIASLTDGSGLDLDRYCTYLDTDLGLRDSRPDCYRAAKQQGQTYNWEERACRSMDCPMRHICRFHLDTDARKGSVEDFNVALVDAVGMSCLGEHQFVGRSRTAFRYQEFLDRAGVAEDDTVHDLLERLGRRGFVVGYLFSDGDGMHGWLTPAETQALLSRLDALALPRYEPTVAAMTAQYGQFGKRQAREGLSGAQLDAAWEALSLSFVRTVAAIAAGKEQGLLWGNDMPSLRAPRDDRSS